VIIRKQLLEEEANVVAIFYLMFIDIKMFNLANLTSLWESSISFEESAANPNC